MGKEAAVGVFVMLLDSAVALHGQFRRQAGDERIAGVACRLSELPDPEVVDDIQRTQVDVYADLSLVGFLVNPPRAGKDAVRSSLEGLVGEALLRRPLPYHAPVPQIYMQRKVVQLVTE